MVRITSIVVTCNGGFFIQIFRLKPGYPTSIFGSKENVSLAGHCFQRKNYLSMFLFCLIYGAVGRSAKSWIGLWNICLWWIASKAFGLLRKMMYAFAGWRVMDSQWSRNIRPISSDHWLDHWICCNCQKDSAYVPRAAR